MSRNNRKDRMFHVRVPSTTHAKAQQLADASGCSMSQLLRTLVEGAQIIVSPPVIEAANQNRAIVEENAVLA